MKILNKKIYLLLFVSITLFSCTNKEKGTNPRNNYLNFKINGVLWESKSEKVFGSYHFNETLGPKMLQIAGSKGDAPKDQPFNINLYSTDAEGTYTFDQDNANHNIAQLVGLTETNLICGGSPYDYNFTVVVTKVSQNPQIVEATFIGTMTCVESSINITEGKFSYHE